MDTSKVNEKINDEGEKEINVEAVDYRKPAGKEEAKPEKVEVTHQLHDDNAGGGGAAAKMAEKLGSANKAVGDAISGMK